MNVTKESFISFHLIYNMSLKSTLLTFNSWEEFLLLPHDVHSFVSNFWGYKYNQQAEVGALYLWP